MPEPRELPARQRMIWNPSHKPRHQVEAFVGDIVSEVSSVVETCMSVSPDDLEELAKGVAFFLAEDGIPPALRADYLLLLISRALHAVGEEDAAEVYVQSVGEKLALPESVRALLARGAVRPCSWRVFASHLARPSEWASINCRTVWVLDLNRIGHANDDCLEMSFFQGVSSIVEQMACVWDQMKGAGILGLRNVEDKLTDIFGLHRKRAAIDSLSEEVKTVCEKKLDALAPSRSWQSRPNVFNLDV